ncbi:MAG: O-methyltransferase [Henriciella sp.]|nr:O-methyltransferase [Henriciella sp.]
MQTEIHTQIDAYFEQNFLKPDPILDRIAQASTENGLVPHAVTRLQAGFLAMLIQMSRAKTVLEIGCLGGYSAVAMARALPDTGRLLTTEIDTRTAKIAQANIDGSGFGDRIELRVGPAMDVLNQERAAGSIFDFVFIDADKVNHKNYLERALEMSKPGSVIVADNIVRGGAVLDAQSQENSVKGVRDMIAFARTLDHVQMTAMQTVGEKGYDGMAIFRVGDP